MEVDQQRPLARAFLVIDLKMEHNVEVTPTTKAVDLRRGGGSRQTLPVARVGGQIPVAEGPIWRRNSRSTARADPGAAAVQRGCWHLRATAAVAACGWVLWAR